MVNRVLGLLRQPRVTSLVTPSTVTQEAMDLVNRAARTVLEERNWGCLTRETALRIPATVSGTGTGDVTNARLRVPVASIALSDLENGATRWHARVLTDGLYGMSAIPIQDASTVGGQQELQFPYVVNGMTVTATADWELYGSVGALPSTIRAVSHAWNQEEPIRLAFGDRYDLRRFQPDWSRISNDPEVMFVGGQTEATGQAGTFGLQYIVWPPPAQETLLMLDVLARFDDLVVDADELPGVPAVLTDLIEIRAAIDGIYGTIANDPDRGARLEGLYERGFVRAIRMDDPQTHRRRIPRPFGQRPLANPWALWESREVPAP
jgi:hypothetical protein